MNSVKPYSAGEVSNVDGNQNPNREVAVDLSLRNFPEI